MTALAVLRHGPTEWNEKGLVQGRSDVPLSAAGRSIVTTWRVPSRFDGFVWMSSPLARSRETAHLLCGDTVVTDGRLAEMSWGEWEGRTLTDLRTELGDLMIAWEARGLDFRAPDGESPRDVQERLRPLLAERAMDGTDTVAVCHKGVIRALYALAIGWDMTDKPPDKMQDNCMHLFRLDQAGRPAVTELNIRL